MIEQSVGAYGVNARDDVLIVQIALNLWRFRRGLKPIAVDAVVGPETIAAITNFQFANGLAADGRADVDGPTIKTLRAALPEEAAIFSATVSHLLQILDSLTELAINAPETVRGEYYSFIARMNPLRKYRDLVWNRVEPPIALAAFHRGANVIGQTIVGEAAATLFLILLAAALVVILIIMAQSPAFRKAVEVRAKELARLLGELNHHARTWFERALELAIEVTNETLDRANDCKNSPSFTPSPECEEAMQNFRDILIKLHRVNDEIKKDIVEWFARGRGPSGIPEIARLLRVMQKLAVDLQVALADMQNKCNCPDI